MSLTSPQTNRQTDFQLVDSIPSVRRDRVKMVPPLYKDQLPSLADLISINITYLCVGTLVRSTSLRISCHQSAIGRLYTCGSVNLKVIQRSVNCHGRAGQLLLGVVHNNLPPIRCCTLSSSDPIPSNHLLPCFPPFSSSSH